jgi:cell division protein FtsW
VASGIFPTTGLPLPFLSYGGTSMLFSAFAVGVLLNISRHTNIIPREQRFDNMEINEPIVGQVYK